MCVSRTPTRVHIVGIRKEIHLHESGSCQCFQNTIFSILNTRTYDHAHSDMKCCTRKYTQTLSLSLFLSHTHTYTYKCAYALTHTNTHTHTHAHTRKCRYVILRSCLVELINRGIIRPKFPIAPECAADSLLPSPSGDIRVKVMILVNIPFDAEITDFKLACFQS